MRSAAILVGGRATRFGGQDKSALVVDGRTILDRQVGELSQVVADLLIVAGKQAGRNVQHPQARIVVDDVPECGPLGGLQAALSACRGDALFLVACDMPYVTASFVRFLFSLASAADIVVPRTDRGYHPLCAVYATGCLDRIDDQLAERRLKMGDLMSDATVRVVESDEIERFGSPHHLLANVNSAADYAGLEAL
jgi:molybdopterin-guanine dinucleotide biosynthesis protein A